MLKEEDIILHGSTIVDSEGLLHGKYKSKHKSKSGKWVYVYDNAKKAVGGLFDKDVTETITKSEHTKNGYMTGASDAKQTALEKVAKAARKSDKNYDRSKSQIASLGKRSISKNGRIATSSATFKNVRKKGSIHKGYDATVRALKGLVK